MDVISTASALDYSDFSPVLIVGSSDICLMRAARTVRALGLRIGDCVPIEDAPSRLSRQAAASAVWIELDRDVTEQVFATLSIVSRDAADGRYAAVVAATPSLVDDLFGVLGDAVHFLIDADDAERASALSLAIALKGERHLGGRCRRRR